MTNNENERIIFFHTSRRRGAGVGNLIVIREYCKLKLSVFRIFSVTEGGMEENSEMKISHRLF